VIEKKRQKTKKKQETDIEVTTGRSSGKAVAMVRWIWSGGWRDKKEKGHGKMKPLQNRRQ
jgi:hypothetical protein